MGNATNKAVGGENHMSSKRELQKLHWPSKLANRKVIWLSICHAKPTGDEIVAEYSDYLKLWLESPEEGHEKRCIEADIPRTFPQRMDGTSHRPQDGLSPQDHSELPRHYASLYNVLGAVVMTTLNIETTRVQLSYISGMSFIASFLLVVGEGDEHFAYTMMVHICRKCAWLRRGDGALTLQAELNRIESVLGAEFPSLREAFETRGLPSAQMYAADFMVMFCKYQLPFDFTVWCWDQMIARDDPAVCAGSALVALLGCSQKALKAKLSRNELDGGFHKLAPLLSTVDRGKFHRVYGGLLDRYPALE